MTTHLEIHARSGAFSNRTAKSIELRGAWMSFVIMTDPLGLARDPNYTSRNLDRHEAPLILREGEADRGRATDLTHESRKTPERLLRGLHFARTIVLSSANVAP
jgi:hypothetical protein